MPYATIILDLVDNNLFATINTDTNSEDRLHSYFLGGFPNAR